MELNESLVMASLHFLSWSCISRHLVVTLPQLCVLCSESHPGVPIPFFLGPSFWAMELLLFRKEERLGTFPPHSSTHFFLCLPDAIFVKFGRSDTNTRTILLQRLPVKVLNPTAGQFPDKKTREGGVVFVGVGQDLVRDNHDCSMIIPDLA